MRCKHGPLSGSPQFVVRKNFEVVAAMQALTLRVQNTNISVYVVSILGIVIMV